MNATAPGALLLLSSSCPYCPTVLQALSELVKEGHLGRLEVVNIGHHPEVAQAHQVRSVPWARIGPFELDGLRSKAELRQWAERSGTTEGAVAYLVELLKAGKLPAAIAFMQRDPAGLDAVAPLLEDAQTDLQVRLGVSAAIEEMRGDQRLVRLIAPLSKLVASPDARIRSDAAHYLSLTGDDSVGSILQGLTHDPDAAVREVASEGLEALRQG